jgi:ABC-type uncharacterized transport system involved in gliding motility auxiliary subunit
VIGSPLRHWAHLLLVVALALGIGTVAQAISERHAVRWDLTPSAAFTLSETSRKTLGLLHGPTELTVFVSRDESEKTRERLQLFAAENREFRFEIVDLDRNPGRAREAGIDHYGKALVRNGDRKIVVDAGREQTIAAGLLLLARGEPTRVAFLAGHGERDLGDGTTPRGYGEARGALGDDSYAIGVLDLRREGEVPANVDLVIVAGPRSDLLEPEVKALDGHLSRGGHLLLLLDPGPLPNVETLLRRHGIRIAADIVADRAHQLLGADQFTIAVPGRRAHEMNAPSAPPLFSVARSVSALPGTPGERPIEVAETHPEAWAIRDAETRGGLGEPDETRDRKGPIAVVVAASWRGAEDRQSRLVVVGDSDFASNAFLDLLGNRDLFLNAVSWLTSAGELVAARSPAEGTALKPFSPMFVTRADSRALFLLLVVAEPGLFLGIGALVVFRRSRRR